MSFLVYPLRTRKSNQSGYLVQLYAACREITRRPTPEAKMSSRSKPKQRQQTEDLAKTARDFSKGQPYGERDCPARVLRRLVVERLDSFCRPKIVGGGACLALLAEDQQLFNVALSVYTLHKRPEHQPRTHVPV